MGRHVRLAAVVLVLASCAAARAQQKRDVRAELQQVYVDHLRREGYAPALDSDGNVEFKHEGGRYVIMIDPEDRAYFQLVFYGFWKVETDADRQRALAAANKVMMRSKIAKVLVGNKAVFATAALFVKEPADFAVFFQRAVAGIQGAVQLFVDEIRKG